MSVVLVLTTGSLAAAGLPEMIVVKTPHFTVMTTGRAAKAQAWAANLERFRLAMGTIIPADPGRLVPVVMVIFANDRELAPYAAPNKNVAMSLVGYFGRSNGVNVVGVTANVDDQSVAKPVIFHSAVHWYANGNAEVVPVWLTEGLGEIFSTFTADEQSFTVGFPIKAHVDYLRRVAVPRPEQVMDWTDKDNEYDDNKRAGRFFAGSWVLTRWALFDSKGPGPKGLQHYLQLLKTEPEAEAAFTAAFGGNYKTVGEWVAQYARDGRYGQVRLKLPAEPLGLEEPRKATEAEVEYALGALLMGSRSAADGLPHLTRATELAPVSTAAWEAVGFAQLEAGNRAEALAAFDRAIETGSKIGEVWSNRAWLRREADGSGGLMATDPAELVPAVKDFRRAIELDPRCENAYEGLAGFASVVEPGDPEDAKRLEAGGKIFPKNGFIKVGVIALRMRSDAPGATAEMKALLANDQSLSTPHRRRAEDILEQAKMKEFAARIDRLRNDREYAKALAEFDRALGDEDISPRNKQRLQRMRDETDQLRRLQEALDMHSNGQSAEAVVLLKKLLDDPGLNGSLRGQITRLLSQWE